MPFTPNIPPSLVDASHLSRRFGPEPVHYGSGSRLNRVSFLRTDDAFLRAAASHPAARFVVLNALDPLVAADDDTHLRTLAYGEVHPALTGGADGEGGNVAAALFAKTKEEAFVRFARGRSGALVVFLGLEEDVEGFVYKERFKGRPWFAVDATPRGAEGGEEHERGSRFVDGLVQDGGEFCSKTRNMTLIPQHAAIYYQARALTDWNTRNKFCAACSRPTIPWDAGYRRICPPSPALPPCPIGSTVSNISFPRTDPAMIAAVVSADGQRLLLGRNRKWPPHRVSLLAGFVEPGESVECAVRREVWEEAGVRVGRVVLHSTQTWPYPNCLMIGAIAQARSDEEDAEVVDVGLDEELESARWFGMDEVREMLAAQRGEGGGMGVGVAATVPPMQAIATRLMAAVVGGFLTGIPEGIPEGLSEDGELAVESP